MKTCIPQNFTFKPSLFRYGETPYLLLVGLAEYLCTHSFRCCYFCSEDEDDEEDADYEE